MKVVVTTPGGSWKKKFTATAASDCLMLVGAQGEVIRIPIGSDSIYLGRNALAVTTDERILKIKVKDFDCYEAAFARDLELFVAGKIPPLRGESYRIKLWLKILALLPFLLPAVTLGGFVSGGIACGLSFCCFYAIKDSDVTRGTERAVCIFLGGIGVVLAVVAGCLRFGLFEPAEEPKVVDRAFSAREEYSSPAPVDLELDRDSDNDGVLGSEEYKNGTDPRKADSDGDLISDRNEIDSRFLDPLVSDLVFRFDFEELQRSLSDGSVSMPIDLVFRGSEELSSQKVGARIQPLDKTGEFEGAFSLGRMVSLDRSLRELAIIDICRGGSNSQSHGFLWGITEQPGDTKLRSMDLNGQLMRELEIPGVSNDGWRTIVTATLERDFSSKTYLYIGDTIDRSVNLSANPEKVRVAAQSDSNRQVPDWVNGIYIRDGDGVYRHSKPGRKSSVQGVRQWKNLTYESDGEDVKGTAILFDPNPKPPTIYRVADPGHGDEIDPSGVETIPFEFERIKGIDANTRFNCSALVVDPGSGDIYLITSANWDTKLFKIAGLAVDEFLEGKGSKLVAKYVGRISGVGKYSIQGSKGFSKTLAADTDGDGSEILLMTEHLMFRASRGARSFEEMLLGTSGGFAIEQSFAGADPVRFRSQFALALSEDGGEYFSVDRKPGLFRPLKRFPRRSKHGVVSGVLGNSSYALCFRGAGSYMNIAHNLGRIESSEPPLLTNDKGRTVGLWFLPYTESGAERLHPLWIVSHAGDSRHLEGLFFRNDSSGKSGNFLFAKWDGSDLPDFDSPDVTVVQSGLVPTGIVYAVALVCEPFRSSLFVGRAIPKQDGNEGTILDRTSAPDTLSQVGSASEWTVGGWRTDSPTGMPSALGVVDGLFCYDAVLRTPTLTSIMRPKHRRGNGAYGKPFDDTDGNGIAENRKDFEESVVGSSEGVGMTMERFEGISQRIRYLIEKWSPVR